MQEETDTDTEIYRAFVKLARSVNANHEQQRYRYGQEEGEEGEGGEDVAGEGLAHLVAHAADSSKLPDVVKRIVANELKKENHELAVWKIADAGEAP